MAVINQQIGLLVLISKEAPEYSDGTFGQRAFPPINEILEQDTESGSIFFFEREKIVNQAASTISLIKF